MRLTIFGTGYVGLVQGAVFADAGHDVVCVDLDRRKVARLSQGIVPIFEPGLETMVRENLSAGRLAFTADSNRGLSHSTVLFVAVGTPPGEDGAADLKHVMALAETIGAQMEVDCTVIVKSTVPVGTCEKVQTRIQDVLARRGLTNLRVRVASNPEFLKEGAAVMDCAKPDRIVIGTNSVEAEALLREIYAPFNRNHQKILAMDLRSAELTKYAANCMLATKISFINEIANLAERLDADIEMVRQGIGADPRIGYQFIYPGVGYGGSCFPKDIRALITSAVEVGFDPQVLRAVESRNGQQKHVLSEKVCSLFGADLRGMTFALWGLSFKPNTDDMRDAPACTIMEDLWKRGAKIHAFDPKALHECRKLYGSREDLRLYEHQMDAVVGADALIVATEWKSFSAPDFQALYATLKRRVIFDGRNMYDPAVVDRHGLVLVGIGRREIERGKELLQQTARVATALAV